MNEPDEDREFVLTKRGGVGRFVEAGGSRGDDRPFDDLPLEKLIGGANDDDRRPVSNPLGRPYRGVFEVETRPSVGSRLECGTAWMISHRVLITAAHVIFPNRRSPRQVLVKQYSASGALVRTREAVTLRVLPQYLNGRNEIRFDFAAIVLSSPINDGHRFGFNNFHRDKLRGSEVEVVGFPIEKARGSMLQHSARITKAGQNSLQYKVDTTKGQSGAPVIKRIRKDGQTFYVAVGIHKGGGSGEYNRAVRITDSVMEQLVSWKNRS